jgi:hypothetical protein
LVEIGSIDSTNHSSASKVGQSKGKGAGGRGSIRHNLERGGAASDTANRVGKVAATIASAPKTDGSQSSGTPATEKHTLIVTEDTGTAVIISINGTWVGQWDAYSGTIPLEAGVHGKNELTVELQGQPQNRVMVELWAQRTEGLVNLLRLNFQGKGAGKYTYPFVAK